METSVVSRLAVSENDDEHPEDIQLTTWAVQKYRLAGWNHGMAYVTEGQQWNP
jgi:hypothetical protein